MAKLSDSPGWRALANHCAETTGVSIKTLFEGDSHRASRYSIDAAGLFVDYSKNPVVEDTMAMLVALAREAGVDTRRDAMFAGERINTTEHRPVLHVALRDRSGTPRVVDGVDVNQQVASVLARMRGFAQRVRSGAWQGHSGFAITDIVNIGIGGSDLGPKMVCEALKAYAHERLSFHFVSNVDGADVAEVLKRANPETTLFIVSSKTFTTRETLANARTARAWLLASGAPEDAIAKHFVAVSTNASAVSEFGIDTDNMFEFWDWVGGRYSLWSAIGLPIVLQVGIDAFLQLLDGAHAMDRHFADTPLERNLPVILGMLGIWHQNFLGTTTQLVAPYNNYLHRLPAYLQQLDMESNGKTVTLEGERVTYSTGSVIWGEPGTNSQHAFFQLLHQGTSVIPVDMIVCMRAQHPLGHHQDILVANCFAQSEALMNGADSDTDPWRDFEGNRPSNTLCLDVLDPASLGALIALYEHKVFVQGVVWGVNSFDQWGVELGKKLAVSIESELSVPEIASSHDSSTNQLINRYKARRDTKGRYS